MSFLYNSRGGSRTAATSETNKKNFMAAAYSYI